MRCVVEGNAGLTAIHTTHGADADAVFGASSGVNGIAEPVDFAARRVVAVEQHLINYNTAAEARANGHAKQVLVAFRIALLLKEFVYFGQQAVQGFAVGKEVAVVVDENRYMKLVLQHGFQGHAATEGGQVLQVADDAVGVVGGTGEAETDGRSL